MKKALLTLSILLALCSLNNYSISNPSNSNTLLISSGDEDPDSDPNLDFPIYGNSNSPENAAS